MLTPELIKKIKKVHIRTRRRVDTMMAGQYRSVFRGSGMEFEEVREYSPGDEVKNIDWKVSARMGRPYVKLFREERELVVMLLVDMSASGNFGTASRTKREVAAEMAAILAFNAIRNNDKVGALLFTSEVEKHIPPQKGAAHVWRVIREIFAFEPQNPGTDIEKAIRYMGQVCRKKTVCFVISDFLSQGYAKQMKIAGNKHEMTGVVLSDPGDFRLPEGGIFLARDFETGETVLLDAFDPKTRKAYADRKREEYAGILESLKSSDVDAIEISTDGDAADSLVRYFRIREKRMR